MKMEDCFGGYHQSRVKTASEESMTYNNQHRRLSGMRAGRKKVELPRGIDEPRSKKHPSQRDCQRRRVTHLSCGYVSTSPLSHRKSGFLNQAHPTATGSNEVIRFIHGPLSASVWKQKYLHRNKSGRGPAPCQQVNFWESESCFSGLGSKKLWVKGHSLDHSQAYFANLALRCPLRGPSQELG